MTQTIEIILMGGALNNDLTPTIRRVPVKADIKQGLAIHRDVHVKDRWTVTVATHGLSIGQKAVCCGYKQARRMRAMLLQLPIDWERADLSTLMKNAAMIEAIVKPAQVAR